jgi:hypothetical protein
MWRLPANKPGLSVRFNFLLGQLRAAAEAEVLPLSLVWGSSKFWDQSHLHRVSENYP